jgi:predicted nucleic-acid-binding Zn-ribbon protein
MNFKKYGVIVCSNCKLAWGIDLSYKIISCPKCRKKYNIKERKIFYQTSDLKKLRVYISKINMKKSLFLYHIF